MAKKLLMRIVLIFSMLLTTCEVWSQEPDECTMMSEMPYLETYLDDLPSSLFNYVMEDSDGFIWGATRDGIVRYDGIGYVMTMSHNEDGPADNNWFGDLLEDTSNNCIWATTSHKKRMVKVDRSTCDTEDFEIKTKDGKVVDFKQYVSNYNDTLLLVVSRNNIVLVDKRDGLVVGECESNGIAVSRLRPDIVNGRLLVSLGKKIYEVEKNGLSPRLKLLVEAKVSGEIPNIPHTYYSNDTTLLLTYSKMSSYNGKMQVSGKQAVSKCNVLTGEVEEICVVPHIVSSMVEMSDGIWIGTQFGLFFYSYEAKELRRYTVRNSKLPSPRIFSLVRSRNQPIVWIGTANGLVKNDYYTSKFSLIDMYWYTNIDVLTVYSIYKDAKGGYWASTTDGLLYRKGDEQFAPCGFDKHNLRVRAIFLEDTTSSTLYITRSNTMYVYDLNRNKLVCSHEFDGSLYKSMHVSGDTLLIAQDSKLLLVKARSGRVINTQVLCDTVKIVPRSLMKENDSIYWLSGAYVNQDLLYRYNIKTNEFSQYEGFDELAKGLNFKDMRLVVRYGQVEMWCNASNGNGLYYFLPKQRKMVRINYSPYFNQHSTIIESDKEGNIWVCCELGIACVNNSNGRVYEYSNMLYSIPKTIVAGASTITADGIIMLTSQQSFVEFDTKQRHLTNTYCPDPIVMQYQYRDAQSEETDSLTRGWTSELVDSVIFVPKGVRSLAMNVRLLNYSRSEYNTIQWRREEDNVWKTSSTLIPILLPNLQPGVTKIFIRKAPMYATNLDDMPVKTIYVNKDSYLYQTTWFQMSAIFIVVAMLSLFIVMRSISQRKRQLQLQLEVDLRTAELQNTNIKLSAIQERVAAQNKELIRTRDHLEEIVAERTEELEKEKARIEEGSKLKSAFLANLSHEVRTPMNCIVGFSKLLADPTCTKEESVEFIHLIKESATSLLALLGDLLDVSRIESGQMRVNFTSFSVYKELQDVYKMLTIEKKKKKVDFLINVQPNISDVVLNSDKDRFRQIIINLVYNAFKFTDDGHVSINAKIIDVEELSRYDYPITFLRPQDDKVLLIYIEDTGIGMPEDKLDVIFEPFRKLNNNKTLYPGLGLGLNICKNLIELVGGKIWVRSIENMGTTFFFYHPILDLGGGKTKENPEE